MNSWWQRRSAEYGMNGVAMTKYGRRSVTLLISVGYKVFQSWNFQIVPEVQNCPITLGVEVQLLQVEGKSLVT